MITIPQYIFDYIVHQAHREAPNESCGIVGGRDNVISSYHALTNMDASAEHFSLNPKEQFATIKELRQNNLKAIGVVHSHPATPARMSEEDKRLALDPDTHYFILSLADKIPVLKCFKADDVYTEVPVTISNDKRPANFRIPTTVLADVQHFRTELQKYQAGEYDDARFRAIRVPMGLYEQRGCGKFMARIRLTAGMITPGQLRILADGAERFGGNKLHLTTRQDIQVHDLPLDNAPDLFEHLLQADLTCRGGGGNTVRTVIADPRAGTLTDEPFDVTGHAVAVTEYLLQDHSAFNLPRKYKLAFSSNNEDLTHTAVADLGFIPVLMNDKRGFKVRSGGGLGAISKVGLSLLDFLPEAHVCHLAEAVKRVFDRHGDRQNKKRARLRFVAERMGAETYRKTILDELETVLAESPDVVQPRRELLHDLSGIPVKNTLPPDITPQKTPGLYRMHLRPELGNVTATAMLKLAELVEQNNLEIRITQNQGILLRNIRGQDLPALQPNIEKLDTALLTPSQRGLPVACAGASTCQLGLCQSRGLAKAITRDLQDVNNEILRLLPSIKISGCPNACGQHPIGELAFSGEAKRVSGHLAPYYKVWSGYQSNPPALAQPIGSIPAKQVPAFVRAVTEKIESNGHHEAPLALLVENNHAILKELVTKHTDIPSYDEAPGFYKDWDLDRDFSLAGRGPGECGAGVIDVVQLDLNAAKESLATYKRNGTDTDLYNATISAMRGLLVLRGVDTKKERVILAAFQEHFVNKGWVTPDTVEIMDALLDYKLGDKDTLTDLSNAIEGLIKRVQDLFISVDRHLQFTIDPIALNTDKEETPAPQPESAKHLDLSGVTCPMNYVQAKVFMEECDMGDIVELLLDDGEPIRNVPESFKQDGQKVLKIKPQSNGTQHLVRIEKTREY